MNQELARACEKRANAATVSAVNAFLSWYVDHAEEIDRITGQLHKPYETYVTVKEILDEGLRELEGAADYFAHAEGESEKDEDCRPLFPERDRSGKDALWEGQE